MDSRKPLGLRLPSLVVTALLLALAMRQRWRERCGTWRAHVRSDATYHAPSSSVTRTMEGTLSGYRPQGLEGRTERV